MWESCFEMVGCKRVSPVTVKVMFTIQVQMCRKSCCLRRLWIVVNSFCWSPEGKEEEGKGGLRECQSLVNPFLLNSGVLLTLRVNVNHQRSKGSRKEYLE